MIKRLVGLLAITIIIVGFCGCVNEKQESTAEIKETVKITDILGREVEVPKNVDKIVCYGPGALRLAVYLNATDKICGITGVEKKYWKGMPYLIAHKELLQKPGVGSGKPGEEPNVERVLEIKPDVIFVTYMSKENADKLQQKTGIPVVVLSYGPLAFIESGPAAGAIAVSYYSKILGDGKVIGFDMGGTTAKASTIINHTPLITNEYEVGGEVHAGRLIKGSGYPVRFPFIDLAEVSAGGGTIAWIDEGNALRVGPISAGADPGPVCYGKGNDKPTITDANLILGRLGGKLSGGTITLRKDLAEKAISKLAEKIGECIEDVALGIIKLANTAMAKALRIVTVERGYDPRDFVMYVFGGGRAVAWC
ncbi:hydantoinase/oxoprolinase family protein [Methanotorris formicicus]|uniref:Hydantoinase/oxoprolinase n=1 Tax=Methanotorris formicicus Mc-S-70 TaxID=647171 RepID=H1KY13_9EURY|nr:hydantoinase/oxoprolinase family protein [Methanotorris formicicus]EHP87565.1 Hydantoinase/oxoprolinase [Methanotorris formicicus Mc-S-70]